MRTVTNSWALTDLPASARVLMTLFLALIGFGYLSALANLYFQHQMADGKPGLTVDDLRATFHGIDAPAEPDSAEAVPRSRMLEMVAPAGEMRKHLSKGGPEAIRSLEHWLKTGAEEAGFRTAGVTDPADPSPEQVIARYCLRCHNADGGEKADAPYGPNLFTTDYNMVYVYAAPGTAKGTPAPNASDAALNRIGPHTVGHLALITHVHMLSIPVFTLIVSGLFLMSHVPPRWRSLIVPIPMAVLVADFASWWLARYATGFIHVIAAAGAVYGLTMGIQLIAVLYALWCRPKDPSAAPSADR